MMAFAILFSSCATIIGGTKYRAHITVKDYPKAEIKHNNIFKGYGTAVFKTYRRDADEFTLQIKKPGCKEQTFTYQSRSFRGWSLAGTIVGWTGVLLIPWGVIVDGITGAWWKPDVKEPGIYKMDFDNFEYVIDYTGCGPAKKQPRKTTLKNNNKSSKVARLREFKALLDEGIITKEEFEREKIKILNED